MMKSLKKIKIIFSKIGRVFFVFILFFLLNFKLCYAVDIPRIAKIYPEYGKINVDTLTEISIIFNTQMDKESIEKNFFIYPEIKGEFSWQENTLIFKPQEPLLPSTSYFVTFTPQLKTTKNIPLVLTYFSTPAQGLCLGLNGNINIVSINGKSEEIPVKGMNPVWTPDNKRVIYEYQGKIWQVNTNGENSVPLLEDGFTFQASQPECNPVADLIAFIGTNAAECDNIYTIETKTKIVKQLTSFFEPNLINNLRWSPDGLYLAFLRAGQVWIMNQDGTGLSKLTTDELTCKTNFAWSPGGTKIVFSGEDNIWIGDIYSYELRKMTFDSPNIGMLDWSNDNKIVFESEGITIMNADGSNELQITTAGKKPVWVNGGEILSFVLPLHKDDYSAQLWIMSANGMSKDKIAVLDWRYPGISWSKNLGFKKLFSP
ncbi:MAG: Ig-like domain-containing protein [Candidatus Omnitrophota bacterium]